MSLALFGIPGHPMRSDDDNMLANDGLLCAKEFGLPSATLAHTHDRNAVFGSVNDCFQVTV